MKRAVARHRNEHRGRAENATSSTVAASGATSSSLTEWGPLKRWGGATIPHAVLAGLGADGTVMGIYGFELFAYRKPQGYINL